MLLKFLNIFKVILKWMVLKVRDLVGPWALFTSNIVRSKLKGRHPDDAV